MKFMLQTKYFFHLLKKLNGSIHNKPRLNILNNILIKVTLNNLKITATNLDTEITINTVLNTEHKVGTTTVSARKLLNICRNLPKESDIYVELINDRIFINSEYIKYSLLTLHYSNFPIFDKLISEVEFEMFQNDFKYLIESTRFSMAQDDARYYLNGMLLKIKNGKIKTVTTDGHRLSISLISINCNIKSTSIIIPRKTIFELIRILDSNNKIIKIKINKSKLYINVDNLIFVSKLIDGLFPSYDIILYNNYETKLQINSNILKDALSRVIIISNKKTNHVKLLISFNKLVIKMFNTEDENAEETIKILYDGPNKETYLDANYIIDILNALRCKEVLIYLVNKDYSVRIEGISKENFYIIMPIFL